MEGFQAALAVRSPMILNLNLAACRACARQAARFVS